MNHLRKFLERRIYPRRIADLPAEVRITGGVDRGYLSEPCLAKVLDVSEGGMRLGLEAGLLGPSELGYCLGDPDAYPLEIVVLPPRGGRWTFLGCLRRLSGDGGEVELAVQFPAGVALPPNCFRMWGVTAP